MGRTEPSHRATPPAPPHVCQAWVPHLFYPLSLPSSSSRPRIPTAPRAIAVEVKIPGITVGLSDSPILLSSESARFERRHSPLLNHVSTHLPCPRVCRVVYGLLWLRLREVICVNTHLLLHVKLNHLTKHCVNKHNRNQLTVFLISKNEYCYLFV